MSNQFFNSIVRGAGLTIGRNAVNSVSRSRMSLGKIFLYGIVIPVLIVIVLPACAWLFYLHGTDAGKAEFNKFQIENKKYEDSIKNINQSTAEMYKGHVVYTGKRGGKYYYSKSGKKVYIK